MADPAPPPAVVTGTFAEALPASAHAIRRVELDADGRITAAEPEIRVVQAEDGA